MLAKRRDDRELMSITFDLDAGDSITEVLDLVITLDGTEVTSVLRTGEPAAAPDGDTVSFWVAKGGERGCTA